MIRQAGGRAGRQEAGKQARSSSAADSKHTYIQRYSMANEGKHHAYGLTGPPSKFVVRGRCAFIASISSPSSIPMRASLVKNSCSGW